MPEETTIEATVSRQEAAETLRRLADGVERGTVQFGAGDDAIVVPVEDELEMELEFEPEEDTVGLEVELTWRDGGVSAAPHDDAEDAPSELDEQQVALPVGPTGARESLARFEVFRDRADEWRWRLLHRNGNVIATGGEGYARKHGAENGLRSVMRNAEGARVEDEG